MREAGLIVHQHQRIRSQCVGCSSAVWVRLQAKEATGPHSGLAARARLQIGCEL
jgi:hypothetical protein